MSRTQLLNIGHELVPFRMRDQQWHRNRTKVDDVSRPSSSPRHRRQGAPIVSSSRCEATNPPSEGVTHRSFVARIKGGDDRMEAAVVRLTSNSGVAHTGHRCP